MDPHRRESAHVTSRRVTKARWNLPHRPALAVAPLAGATVTVIALLAGPRLDGPGQDPGLRAPDTAEDTTGADYGAPNPWAAGDAAVARYLAEHDGSC
jgi:hypothetical protein